LDIRQPIKRSIESVLPSGKQNGIRLETRIDDDLPPIWGDERALTECFAHILRNSVEALAHRQGGRIELVAMRT
jgi:signal transduction histidine kinase